MIQPDGPVWWSNAREPVIVALVVASVLSVLSGLLQAINADTDAVGDRVLIFGQQLRPGTAGLMVLAAVVLVSGRARVVRVDVRVMLFRVNVVLSVAAAFCVLATLFKPGPTLLNRLIGVTRASGPALVLFVLAAWLARSVIPDPARAGDD